jgi:hypothetical protein
MNALQGVSNRQNSAENFIPAMAAQLRQIAAGRVLHDHPNQIRGATDLAYLQYVRMPHTTCKTRLTLQARNSAGVGSRIDQYF